MIKVIIDYTKCIGNKEKICVEICPVSIFREDNSEKPKAVNEEKCILCKSCQVNCPTQAIEISTF